MKLYVVGHRVVTGANATGFDADDLRRWVRWYIANEAVADRDVRVPQALRVDEWALPWHDPLQQLANFYNNSALWHVWKNPGLHDDFVGFAQYDMVVPRAAVAEFAAIDAPLKVGYMQPSPAADFWHTPLPREAWAALAARLTCLPLDTLLAPGMVLPLCHAFVLPLDAFLDMMRFAESALPGVLRALGHDTRHLAGTLERVFALWIVAAVRGRRLGPVLHMKGVVHDPSRRLPDALRGL